MTSPEQIQAEIERTRANLSSDVDRLTEKVAPGKVMNRRVEDVKGSASSLRDRLMGSADDGGGLRGAGDTLSAKTSDLTSGTGSTSQAMRRHAQGSPLAVGLVAFGTGMLLSSLAPASRAEQNLAETAGARAKDLAEPLKQTGQEVAENLKSPVQESVEQVKESAVRAARDTADQARVAAQDVKKPMQR
jgi:hypothetical protein